MSAFVVCGDRRRDLLPNKPEVLGRPDALEGQANVSRQQLSLTWDGLSDFVLVVRMGGNPSAILSAQDGTLTSLPKELPHKALSGDNIFLVDSKLNYPFVLTIRPPSPPPPLLDSEATLYVVDGGHDEGSTLSAPPLDDATPLFSLSGEVGGTEEATATALRKRKRGEGHSQGAGLTHYDDNDDDDDDGGGSGGGGDTDEGHGREGGGTNKRVKIDTEARRSRSPSTTPRVMTPPTDDEDGGALITSTTTTTNAATAQGKRETSATATTTPPTSTSSSSSSTSTTTTTTTHLGGRTAAHELSRGESSSLNLSLSELTDSQRLSRAARSRMSTMAFGPSLMDIVARQLKAEAETAPHEDSHLLQSALKDNEQALQRLREDAEAAARLAAELDAQELTAAAARAAADEELARTLAGDEYLGSEGESAKGKEENTTGRSDGGGSAVAMEVSAGVGAPSGADDGLDEETRKMILELERQDREADEVRRKALQDILDADMALAAALVKEDEPKGDDEEDAQLAADAALARKLADEEEEEKKKGASVSRSNQSSHGGRSKKSGQNHHRHYQPHSSDEDDDYDDDDEYDYDYSSADHAEEEEKEEEEEDEEKGAGASGSAGAGGSSSSSAASTGAFVALTPAQLKKYKLPEDIDYGRYRFENVPVEDVAFSAIATEFQDVGYKVLKITKIVNEFFEMRITMGLQLMMAEAKRQGRAQGFEVNERFMYHTSRAKMSDICDLGLDLRHANPGNFGKGIYMSDDPRKCDSYWSLSGTRYMYRCRALLGTTKTYPKGATDGTLIKAPNGYDSVAGNVSGHDEYIVYDNMYSQPEFIVFYEGSPIPINRPPPPVVVRRFYPGGARGGAAALPPMQRCAYVFPTTQRQCTKRQRTAYCYSHQVYAPPTTGGGTGPVVPFVPIPLPPFPLPANGPLAFLTGLAYPAQSPQYPFGPPSATLIYPEPSPPPTSGTAFWTVLDDTSEAVVGDAECPICLSALKDTREFVVQLKVCKHFLHEDCATSHPDLKRGYLECPLCHAISGVRTGDMPMEACMRVTETKGTLAGFGKSGIIQVTYNFWNTPNTANSRLTYFPNNQEGKAVVEKLKTAFKRRLTFTVGTSISNGGPPGVTWNGIHHKTALSGGPTHYGYPDPTYLSRVTEELAAVGIL